MELLVAQPASKLWIEGTSTMKSFSCKAAEFTLEGFSTLKSPSERILEDLDRSWKFNCSVSQ